MVENYNILVTGSNGQLGMSLKDVSNSYPYIFFFKGKSELDITNFSFLENFLIKNKINIVINCAAYTNVNDSEVNKELALLVNSKSVDNLSKLCCDLGIQLIHISTDYVFDGKKDSPYCEKNLSNPINFYGYSKLKGEENIFRYDLNKSLIIRTSWLFSSYGNNFVKKIMKMIKSKSEFFVVKNEVGSPTYAKHLAETIFEIIPKINNSKTEIYHYSSNDFCSRYEFADAINKLISGKAVIKPKNDDFLQIKRPKFSALDSSKICKDFNLEVKSWKENINLFYSDVFKKV